MLFKKVLKIGHSISSSQLAEHLGIKTLKTTRFIKEKNALIIVADYSKGLHPDKWIGDTLHLTGVGHTGDQKITGSTNAKLADSRTTGIEIHLFQVLRSGVYTYAGPVKLVADPYTTIQPDKNGTNRRVWVFTLRPTKKDQVTKPEGLVFSNMADYLARGNQAIRDFVRQRDHYLGYPVRHRQHGKGIVTKFDGSILTVSFENGENRTYNFAKSTTGGHLRFID